MLADRYGLNSSTTSRRILLVFGVLLSLLIAAALAWQISGLAGPNVAVNNNGHTIESDSEVSIRYTVSGEKGLEVECHATAVNSVFAEVGATTVTHTMGADRETYELLLATSERASSGSIKSCGPAE